MDSSACRAQAQTTVQCHNRCVTATACPTDPAAPPDAASTLLALSCAAGLSGLSLRLTDALLPYFSQQFGVSVADTSWVITAFALAYGTALLVLGPLGDRFGKRRLIACSCAASAVASLACALAPNLPSLVAARALTGATTASIIPLSMAWIGDHFAFAARQPVLARFLLGQIIGMSLGAWLGGFAADHLTPSVAFTGVALAFVGIALVLFRTLRRQPEALLPGTPGTGLVAGVVRSMWQVMGLAWARRILVTVALEGALLYGVIAFTATHLHRQHGLALATAGAMVMLFGLGGAMYALGSQRLLQRMGPRGLVLGGGLLMTAGITVLAWLPAWWAGIPGCWLCGLGFYMLHNTLQTQATQMAPAQRGAAVSLFACCFFMGQATGVALLGASLQWWDSALSMSLCALGLLGLALWFARSLQRRAAMEARS